MWKLKYIRTIPHACVSTYSRRDLPSQEKSESLLKRRRERENKKCLPLSLKRNSNENTCFWGIFSRSQNKKWNKTTEKSKWQMLSDLAWSSFMHIAHTLTHTNKDTLCADIMSSSKFWSTSLVEQIYHKEKAKERERDRETPNSLLKFHTKFYKFVLSTAFLDVAWYNMMCWAEPHTLVS